MSAKHWSRTLAKFSPCEDGTGMTDNISDVVLPVSHERYRRAHAAHLEYLVMDLLDYEADAWAYDDEINGGDLVEFVGAWRERAKALLPEWHAPSREPENEDRAVDRGRDAEMHLRYQQEQARKLK